MKKQKKVKSVNSGATRINNIQKKKNRLGIRLVEYKKDSIRLQMQLGLFNGDMYLMQHQDTYSLYIIVATYWAFNHKKVLQRVLNDMRISADYFHMHYYDQYPTTLCRPLIAEYMKRYGEPEPRFGNQAEEIQKTANEEAERKSAEQCGEAQQKAEECRQLYASTTNLAASNMNPATAASSTVKEIVQNQHAELRKGLQEKEEICEQALAENMAQFREKADNAIAESLSVLNGTMSEIMSSINNQKKEPLREWYGNLKKAYDALLIEEPDVKQQLQHLQKDLFSLLYGLESALGAYGVSIYVPEQGSDYDEEKQALMDENIVIPDFPVVSHCICPGFMDQNGDILEDGRRMAVVSLVSRSEFGREENRT